MATPWEDLLRMLEEDRVTYSNPRTGTQRTFPAGTFPPVGAPPQDFTPQGYETTYPATDAAYPYQGQGVDPVTGRPLPAPPAPRSANRVPRTQHRE